MQQGQGNLLSCGVCVCVCVCVGHKYADIISLENLFAAWEEFRVGKKSKLKVQAFERHLMTNLITLHESLVAGTYRHAPYKTIIINDPKRRVINIATVCDRVLHRAIYRQLYPFSISSSLQTHFPAATTKAPIAP